MIYISSLASQTAYSGSWALKIFMYRSHVGILGTAGPMCSGAERLIVGQVLEQAPSEPVSWHHLHMHLGMLIRPRVGQGRAKISRHRERTPTQHRTLRSQDQRAPGNIQQQDLAATCFSSWCWQHELRTRAHRVVRVVPGQAGLLSLLALLGHKGVLNHLAVGSPAQQTRLSDQVCSFSRSDQPLHGLFLTFSPAQHHC